MKKILESKKYDMFMVSDFNRDVLVIKELEDSMKKHGWVDDKPMVVYPRNGDGLFVIKDGHHRFVVARLLGLPVKFVVSESEITMYDLEKTKRPWKLKDWLYSRARQGNPDYLAVKEYCEETGIKVGIAASMLMGHTASGSEPTRAIKTGEYRAKSNKHAEAVKEIVLCMKKHGIKFYNSTPLVEAISKVVAVPAFSLVHLKSKIKAFPYAVEKKATLDQYLDMLEALYNRQSKQKIPLKFMANEEAKKRSPIKRKAAR